MLLRPPSRGLDCPRNLRSYSATSTSGGKARSCAGVYATRIGPSPALPAAPRRRGHELLSTEHSEHCSELSALPSAAQCSSACHTCLEQLCQRMMRNVAGVSLRP